MTKIHFSNFNMKDAKWFDKKLIKKIFKIGFPLIIINLVFSLSSVIDQISLGFWTPKDGIAISSFANRLYWFTLLIVFMFPTTFQFLVAQYYGAKQYEKEKQVIASTIFFTTLFSIISYVLIYFFGKQIIQLFVNKNVSNFKYLIEESYQYIKILGFLLIIESIIKCLSMGIIAEGKTKFAALITLFSLPLNFLLNYVFIKNLNMGVIGCAYSTLISWFVVLIMFIIWIIIFNKKKYINFGFNPLIIFKIDKEILKNGFKRFGLGFAQIVSYLSIILTMTIFSRYYKNGIYITSMINPFFNIIMFIGAGITSTKSHFVGVPLGAGEFKKAYQNDNKINFYSFFFGIINALFIAIIAYPIPLLYLNQTSKNQTLATYALLIIALSYPIVTLANSYLSSLSVGGRGNERFLANSIQPLILEVGLLWIITIYIHPSFVNIYFLYRLFKALKVITIYLFWRRKKWINNEIINSNNLMKINY